MDQDIDLEKTNIAAMLHEITKSADKDVQKIIKKAQKAAMDGKSNIKIKCSEHDYKLLAYPSLNRDMPMTPLVEALKNLGFHLSSDYTINMFTSNSYTLTISW